MERREKTVSFALAGATAFLIALPLRDAGACSCAAPSITLVTPDRVDDAPLNTKIRVANPRRVGGVVLRAHGGAEVPVTTRSGSAVGGASIELTPTQPLAPSTRYEVAVIDPTRYPSTTVFGTFRTGGTADLKAPRFEKMGVVAARRALYAGGGMCQAAGPWVTVDGLVANDPERPNAQIAFGVWLGDANGVVDAKKPPDSVLRPDGDHIVVGQESICVPRTFTFPQTPHVWLGIAAIDEAGNTSAMRRVHVDLAGATNP